MRPVRGARNAASRASARASGRKPQRAKPVAPHREPRRRAAPKPPSRLERLAAYFVSRFVPSRLKLWLSASAIVLVLIAILFASGAVRRAGEKLNAVASAMSNYAGFAISKPEVTGENRTGKKLILDVLNLQPGQSIFAADLGAARARLMRLPWVADARVTRRYPREISVAITEKVPFALWQSPNGVVVIDNSGVPIVPAGARDYPKLPVFVGDPPIDGAKLVAAIGLHRAVAARVTAMQRVSGRRWNLILDSGVVVKLPETGWEKELDTLERLIVDKGILERDIEEIDLRMPDQFFFTLHGQKQSQPVPRETKI